MLNSANLKMAKHYGAYGQSMCFCQDCRGKNKEIERKELIKQNWVIGALMALGLVLASCMLMTPAHADQLIDGKPLGAWVNAIGHAENSKTHPYGILFKYKHTSPYKACENTVKHKYNQWIKAGSKGEFIHYLASKYAPINSDTDIGTNRFWEVNVYYFLKHENTGIVHT